MDLSRDCVGAGPGPVHGVLHNLERNRRQLQHNLQHAAAVLPLAHASGGLAKALQHDLPAALTAAAERVGSAAAAFRHRQQQAKAAALRRGRGRGQQQQGTEQHPTAEVVCTEYTNSKRRVYRRKPAAQGEAPSSSGGGGGEEFLIEDDIVRHRQRLSDITAEYMLPQGYPDSVAPQYAPYMRARAWQYLFGGALSVFTTRSLLSSLGFAHKGSGEAAAAINWAVKDGAGRLGRFLFARWGRNLDCELKQFRLAGDLLMEAGAALELSTAMMPGAFLPLACTANLAKNLAAVAIVSTRAPIYRTFALRNNLADVTAKGESVANLADVVGTALGIALAKANLPVVPTFTVLSLGYLVASRKEVDTVILPYLNRARLSYVARKFFATGSVPALAEGNFQEPIMPWNDPHNGRVVLGASVEEACAGPQQLRDALAGFSGRQYALTYRPDTGKCYALLKQGASLDCVLQAATDAHFTLCMMDHSQHVHKEAAVAAAAAAAAAVAGASASAAPTAAHEAAPAAASARQRRNAASAALSSSGNGPSRAAAKLQRAVQELSGAAERLSGQQVLEFVAQGEHYREFRQQAVQAGWRLHMTALNPRETRLAVA